MDLFVTVVLRSYNRLGELAPLVRKQLGLSAKQMPLACVLEGGTWAAGRALAQKLHAG